MRRTNVIETSGLALVLAYNFWLCGFDQFSSWYPATAQCVPSLPHCLHYSQCSFNWSSAPLLSNILPHLQTLLNFITKTLPKPVLVALLYRLIVLHFASQILPTIGADSWEGDSGVDDGWDGRPVS